MAIGAVTLYTQGALNICSAKMNLAADNFNAILVSNSYVPAVNTDSTYANVSAAELTTSGGYTVGGVTLGGDSLSASSGVVTATFANPSWSTFSAGPFRYVVVVHRAGSSLISSDLLLYYVDLTGSSTGVTGAGGPYTIAWNASGAFTVTHNP